MSDVVIVAYESRRDAVELASLVQQNLDPVLSLTTHFIEGSESVATLSPDSLVVSLGGDGTFLRAARIAHSQDARVLGVNLGRVGFLLSVPPESLLVEIQRALRGELAIEPRVALRVTSPHQPIDEFCLNEVVLERNQIGHMVRVRTFIDQDEFLTYSADGVMVATATGSTGYNFSAGGPVLSPELNALVLTPIAPHFTIDRSIVVGSQQPIRLQTLDRDAAIVCDGKLVGHLSPGERIDVAQDPRSVRVVTSGTVGLGTRIRQSLREGHA